MVSGIASAVLALGIVTFASEFILKTAFTEDVLDISNLRHEIYNAGIERVSNESDIDWAAICTSSRNVRVVALRPSRWKETMWPHILRSASSHPLAIQVVFVDPESASLNLMAHRLDVAPETYAAEIKETARAVESEWKRSKTRASWNKQSTIQIDIIDGVSAHSVVRVDGITCLIAEPLLAASGSQATMVFVFRDMEGASVPQRWLAEGLDDVNERVGVPLYSDIKREGS